MLALREEIHRCVSVCVCVCGGGGGGGSIFITTSLHVNDFRNAGPLWGELQTHTQAHFRHVSLRENHRKQRVVMMTILCQHWCHRRFSSWQSAVTLCMWRHGGHYCYSRPSVICCLFSSWSCVEWMLYIAQPNNEFPRYQWVIGFQWYLQQRRYI